MSDFKVLFWVSIILNFCEFLSLFKIVIIFIDAVEPESLQLY